MESTERYYQETVPKHLQTWPACVTAGIKRKNKVTTQAFREINSLEDRPVKTSRQLQLWEPHPGKVDEQASHADPPQDMDAEASPPLSTREEDRQLQWIHRWLEEGTIEELQAQRQKAALRGSSIL